MREKSAPAQDCVLCGDVSGATLVCVACERSLPVSRDMGEVQAAFAYAYPLDRLVQRFKYAGDLALGRWLGLRLAERVRGARRPDLLAAPPLGPARLRERGFNQAHELAKTVGARLGIPVLRRGLVRGRETAAQPGLGRGARRANLAGVFECRMPLLGRRVAIVDDVFTTGATADALAGALRASGAEGVDLWVVAATPPPGD